MNNCFLTILTDSHLESTLSVVENIIKELLRKFRRSVSFYHVKTYSIRPNDENAKQTVLRKMENSSATVVIENHLSHEKLAFYEEDYFSVQFHEHHIGGKCIIAPKASENFGKENGLCTKSFVSDENVKVSVNAAIEKAAKRKSHIIVCTESYVKSGELIMNELESRGNLKGISIEYLTIDEFIWQHIRSFPFSDVILTDPFCEKIIALHLSASSMHRDGYVCFKGQQKSIYLRELLPFDEMNNCFLSGILLSYAYAIENEMNMPNISSWLKRAVGIASERCINSSSDEFVKEVILAINHRIRRERTVKNDNRD